MTCGVITIDFDEIGWLHDGHQYGSFSGSAEIDQNGTILSLALETCGYGKPIWHVDVPAVYDPNNLICMLADCIAGRFKDEIKDKLDDWHVSLAEKEWNADEAVA